MLAMVNVFSNHINVRLLIWSPWLTGNHRLLYGFSSLVTFSNILAWLFPPRFSDKSRLNCSRPDAVTLYWLLPIFFFLGGVTATAPSRDLTDNKKKEEGGLKQRRKQKEAAQGDPEPKKGNQEKEKNPRRVQS